jgi:hypothetical protein
MPTARLLSLIVALAVSMAGGGLSTLAQTPVPSPAKAPREAIKATWGDIEFYLAHGDADACGPGCNEWIAADGKIDAGAASRLRRLVAKLGRRKPTIFLHSPGGLIVGSIELGRLIREQKLTVSVGHTIPRACDRDKPSDKACETLKRSGQELAAELDSDVALCASACVYVLAGGVSRLVPPWVKLGIHDMGFDPDRKLPRGAPVAEATRDLHDKLQAYLRDMGFDKSLFAAASAVPNQTMRFIERDEIVRFGLDRREFGEGAWSFADKPTPHMLKGFFARALDGAPPTYRNGVVTLGCVEGRGILLISGQERPSSAPQSPDPLPVRFGVNGKEVELAYQATSGDLDVHAAPMPGGLLEAIGHDATVTLLGFAGSQDGSARDVTLSMVGFSAAYAKLRESCDEPAQAAAPSLPRTSTAPSAGPRVKQAIAAPAPQKLELVRTAPAERKLLLDFIDSNCQMREMTVSVTEQPRHGALTIQNDQADPCKPLLGVNIFYEPAHGYAGPDSLTLNVAYPLGAVATRHYSIEVK